MNPGAVLPGVLALCCIVAVGVSATTLESSIRTDPDEVIDLDWRWFPLGEDLAVVAKQEIEESRAGRHAAPETRPGDGSNDALRPGASLERQLSAAAATLTRAAGGGGGDTESLLDRLWPLLALLATLALLAAGAVAWSRYRDRLRGLLPSRGRAGPVEGSSREWPAGEPPTEVERAWVAMVRRANVERPWTKTPAECAAAAVDHGMDPDAVWTLTAEFEAVCYGGASVTEDRRRRVRRGLGRLGVEPAGGSA